MTIRHRIAHQAPWFAFFVVVDLYLAILGYSFRTRLLADLAVGFIVGVVNALEN